MLFRHSGKRRADEGEGFEGHIGKASTFCSEMELTVFLRDVMSARKTADVIGLSQIFWASFPFPKRRNYIQISSTPGKRRAAEEDRRRPFALKWVEPFLLKENERTNEEDMPKSPTNLLVFVGTGFEEEVITGVENAQHKERTQSDVNSALSVCLVNVGLLASAELRTFCPVHFLVRETKTPGIR
jgi:hypothetical protein